MNAFDIKYGEPVRNMGGNVRVASKHFSLKRGWIVVVKYGPHSQEVPLHAFSRNPDGCLWAGGRTRPIA